MYRTVLAVCLAAALGAAQAHAAAPPTASSPEPVATLPPVVADKLRTLDKHYTEAIARTLASIEEAEARDKRAYPGRRAGLTLARRNYYREALRFLPAVLADSMRHAEKPSLSPGERAAIVAALRRYEREYAEAIKKGTALPPDDPPKK